MTMRACSACRGFVPGDHDPCPNCGASQRALPRFVAIAAGGMLAVTLAACYGAPSDTSTYCDDLGTDLDRDGYCGQFDCDETNVNVHANALDTTVDSVDQDCNGSDGLPPDAGL